jgi:hypothetical protein
VTVTRTTARRATVIRLTRTSEWKNRFRAFAVFIDGVKVGTIRNGRTVTFPIGRGEHELFVKIDWCASNAVGLRLTEGVTVELSCGSGFAVNRPAAAALSGIEGAYVAVWPTGA